MNAKDIITWVESQVVDISNEQNIINFVSDLQNDRLSSQVQHNQRKNF